MSENSKPIVFETTVNEKQYKSAYWSAAWKAGALRLWPLTLLVDALIAFVYCQIILALQYDFVNRYTALVAIVMIAIPVSYLIYGIHHVRKRIRYYWRAYRQQGVTRKMSIHRTSVVVDTEAFCSQIPFADCVCLVVKKDCYVLVQSGKSFIIIAKNDIPNKYRGSVKKILEKRFSRKERRRKLKR